jgi:hypothetical protein
MAASEGAPDASASVARQHGQADGDLGQTDHALEDDIPGRDIGGQDTGQLQDHPEEAEDQRLGPVHHRASRQPTTDGHRAL